MKSITYKQITETNLQEYESLMLPMIYEELKAQTNIEENNYLALAAVDGDTQLGALVAELEDNGDLNLLSIWTDQAYRREGVASALLQKMAEIVSALYNWDDGQYGEDITLKIMYCLDDKYRDVLENWLEKNDFTDFYILQDGNDERPDICGATAEIHIFRYF